MVYHSDTHKLPIYTLRLPFQRIYVVNDTGLIQALQRQWRVISFAAITARAGAVCGMSKRALGIMGHDLTNENAFSISWPRYIAPALAPGPELDAINKKAAELFASKLTNHTGTFKTGLREWSQRIMNATTTEAIYGPQNPYREPAVMEAWETLEASFLTFSLFPFAIRLFPKIYGAREVVAAAMMDYIRRDAHQHASGLVRKRFEHHSSFNLDVEDIGRGEVGNTFGILANSTPCAFWLLFHIFSDAQVLADVRRELQPLLHKDDDEGRLNFNAANVRTSCPLLLSTFEETLRYRSVGVGPRAILEDVLLDDRFLLKRGSLLLIPSSVQHSSRAAWGEDAGGFRHTRFFVPEEKKREKKQKSRAAFRPFGGGHTLCPGRHFASAEIMMLAALCVLQFDVVPAGGEWVEPTFARSPSGATFPVPDEDIMVEFRPRLSSEKLRVFFSGSGEAMKIANEDL